MNRFFKTTLVVLISVFLPTSAWCQRQTKKVIENAIENGKYEVRVVRDSYRAADYFSPYKECWFRVSKCDIDKDDFDAFFNQNPQFKSEDVKTRKEFKFSQEFFYVTSFSFHNNHDKLSCMELCVRSANKNFKLELPSFNNFKEVSSFYQKYVKPFPDLTEMYKEKFREDFGDYIKNNPDGMKQFCEGSPYQNNELVKEIDVWSLLQNCNKKYDYIYYLTADNGYFFDKNGIFGYQGDIKNGKPNGKGKNGGWEGTFKDGKKIGPFTYTYYYLNRTDGMKYKLTGTCVDDKWEGEVVKETTCNNSSYSDVEKEYYSKGNLVRSEFVSDRMSKDLQEQERIRREQNALAKERAREREAERKQGEVAGLGQQDNIKNAKVELSKSYKVSFPDGIATEYHVTFRDGKCGTIGKIDWKKSWYYNTRWNPDSAVGSAFWVYGGDSQQEAIEALYKALH